MPRFSYLATLNHFELLFDLDSTLYLRFPVSTFNLQELWVWGQDWPLSWPLYCSWVLMLGLFFPHSCLVLPWTPICLFPSLLGLWLGGFFLTTSGQLGLLVVGHATGCWDDTATLSSSSCTARAWTIPCSSSMISPWRHVSATKATISCVFVLQFKKLMSC